MKVFRQSSSPIKKRLAPATQSVQQRCACHTDSCPEQCVRSCQWARRTIPNPSQTRAAPAKDRRRAKGGLRFPNDAEVFHFEHFLSPGAGPVPLVFFSLLFFALCFSSSLVLSSLLFSSVLNLLLLSAAFSQQHCLPCLSLLFSFRSQFSLSSSYITFT